MLGLKTDMQLVGQFSSQEKSNRESDCMPHTFTTHCLTHTFHHIFNLCILLACLLLTVWKCRAQKVCYATSIPFLTPETPVDCIFCQVIVCPVSSFFSLNEICYVRIFHDHALLAQSNKPVKMLILEHAIKQVFSFYLEMLKSTSIKCNLKSSSIVTLKYLFTMYYHQ